MPYRKFLLITCAGSSLLVAFASMAMPLGRTEPEAIKPFTLVGDSHDHGASHHHGRKAHDRAAQDRDDDDEDDGEDEESNRSHGNAGVPPQNLAPPAHGLITPGSRPDAQTY